MKFLRSSLMSVFMPLVIASALLMGEGSRQYNLDNDAAHEQWKPSTGRIVDLPEDLDSFESIQPGYTAELIAEWPEGEFRMGYTGPPISQWAEFSTDDRSWWDGEVPLYVSFWKEVYVPADVQGRDPFPEWGHYWQFVLGVSLGALALLWLIVLSFIAFFDRKRETSVPERAPGWGINN